MVIHSLNTAKISGRHNALDKLYGFCLERHIPVRDKVLIFSGRISSEILIKAAKIGVGVILSKSAPTTLAVKLADDLNITAIGFAEMATSVYIVIQNVLKLCLRKSNSCKSTASFYAFSFNI